MAGRIHSIINQIVTKKSNGVKALESTTRSKIIMKGIYPGNYNETSEDDPLIIAKLRDIAFEFQLNDIDFY